MLCVAVATVVISAPVYAQDEPASLEDRLQRLEDENAALKALVEKLSQDVQDLRGQAPAEEPAGGLPDVEELLQAEPGAPQSAGATGQAGGDPDLNPLMAYTFDWAANALDTQPALYDTSGRNRERVLGLRSIELNAKRGVSAYADAFVTYGDHGHGPELEEGYGDINRLLPRINVRLGKWRVPFGPYNGVHEHQLPFLNYPRTVTNFFGGEGCIGQGGEITYLPSFGDYLELRAGAYKELGSETDFMFTPDPGARYSYSARARYNRQLGPEQDLDLTLSHLNGPNDDAPGARTRMWNASLQWRQDRGNQHTDRFILDWTGMNRDTGLGRLDRSGWSAAYLKQTGLFHEYGLLYEDSQFGQAGILGRARAASAFLTWKAQETQWFRVQYRHGTYPSGPDSDELILQSIWSIGSHSHEFQ